MSALGLALSFSTSEGFFFSNVSYWLRTPGERAMQFSASDEAYLEGQIRTGQVALILGAGASAMSQNRHRQPIKTGQELARRLCQEAGFPFSGEPLSTVFEALTGRRLSDVQIRNIFSDEYCNTTPSQALIDLFRVCWRRVYTLNIDDTLEAVGTPKSKQRLRFYNGMIDKVADFDGPLNLHIVYLHGQASKPEHGFIFSDTEYSKAGISDRLFWYNRAVQDYLLCPVFIGSKIDEPLFWSQVERAKRIEMSASGLGFVVTPSKLSDIQSESIRAKGLLHVQGGLEDFSAWLRAKFPSGITPRCALYYRYFGGTKSLSSAPFIAEPKVMASPVEARRPRFFSGAAKWPALARASR
jgi:hypothetical protein